MAQSIYRKWEKTGLLEGLEVKKRKYLALMFNDLAKMYVNEEPDEFVHDVTHYGLMDGLNIIMFPILRRVFTQCDDIKRKYISSFLTWLKLNCTDEKYINFKSEGSAQTNAAYFSVDWEAEWCAQLTEDYLKEFCQK